MSSETNSWKISVGAGRTGVYYDQRQYSLWNEVGTFEDRISFMSGSYNAGRGTPCPRAQRVSVQEGLPGNRWEPIEAVAPKVRRWGHKETIGCGEKIFNLMGERTVE